MAKRFIYLANYILPLRGFSPLQSTAGVLRLALEEKKGFHLRKSTGSEDVNLNSDCADALFTEETTSTSIPKVLVAQKIGFRSRADS